MSKQERVDALFEQGIDSLEYGASEAYPFGSSASQHWREQGRKVLHLSHILSQLDESIAEQVFETLEANLV